jgi:hypothetical protein
VRGNNNNKMCLAARLLQKQQHTPRHHPFQGLCA